MKEFGKILLIILFSAGGSIGWILGGEQGIYIYCFSVRSISSVDGLLNGIEQ